MWYQTYVLPMLTLFIATVCRNIYALQSSNIVHVKCLCVLFNLISVNPHTHITGSTIHMP